MANKGVNFDRIRVNHEVPLQLLDKSFIFNDYDFILPHLLDEHEEYRQYAFKSKELSRYMVMDNSLHELGEAYDRDRLKYWVEKLTPKEFVVPDVWENKDATLANSYHYKVEKPFPSTTKMIAVVQGKSYEEAKDCYQQLRMQGYIKICFSYGATFYKNIFPHENEHVSRMMGRVFTIFKLYEEGVIEDHHSIHLLGCQLPQEFTFYKHFRPVESIDTSNPIMAALNGDRYEAYGLLTKPTPNLNNNFEQEINPTTLDLVRQNVILFRVLNGMQHYTEIQKFNNIIK